jgi:hypothetical protein
VKGIYLADQTSDAAASKARLSSTILSSHSPHERSGWGFKSNLWANKTLPFASGFKGTISQLSWRSSCLMRLIAGRMMGLSQDNRRSKMKLTCQLRRTRVDRPDSIKFQTCSTNRWLASSRLVVIRADGTGGNAFSSICKATVSLGVGAIAAFAIAKSLSHSSPLSWAMICKGSCCATVYLTKSFITTR